MSRGGKAVLIAIVVFAVGVCCSRLLPNFFSARRKGNAMEAGAARHLRSWAVPAEIKHNPNPLQSSPELLGEAAHHFADHCASCHGNDGSGNTEMGRRFYPPVPDMRLPATQQLSDGELYYVIHNGVRWSGMPAWGEAENDPDSWKLVLFIRHLPAMTPEEMRGMEPFNPRSAADRAEEEREEKFLQGEPVEPGAPKENHHSEKTK